MGGCLICRVMEITERVMGCLGQREAECSIVPAPPDTCSEDSSTTTIIRRCASDASAAYPLRRIVSGRKVRSADLSALEEEERAAGVMPTAGHRREVVITLDHTTTASYTLVNIVCADRKGGRLHRGPCIASL